MVLRDDGGTDAGRTQAGIFASSDDRSLPRRQPGFALAAALVIVAASAAGLTGCGAGHRQPPAAGRRAAASASPVGKVHPSPRAAAGSTSPPGVRPPAGLTPDVTLAYFQQGIGLVGVAPLGGGWQGYKPSTLWLATRSGHWRDVTPAAARRATHGLGYPFFENASFLSPTTGWVTTWNPATDAVTMYSTRDGGARWTVAGHSGHTANAGAADLIQLVTPQVAFSETLEPTGPGMDLRATADGGRSWRTVYTGPPPRQPGSPLAGPFEMPMVFISPSHGFAAGGIPPADPFAGPGDFFATSDGGRNWVRQSPPLARPRSACAAPPGNPAPCFFGLPVFTGATRGVLPSEVLTKTSATVGFATTTDSGNTWTLTATLHVPLARRARTAAPPSGYALTALPSASTWWVLAAARRGVATWVSTDAGRTWSTATTDAAVPGTPLTLQAIDARHAWLTTEVRTQAGGSQELYATTDAGRHWHQVHPG